VACGGEAFSTDLQLCYASLCSVIADPVELRERTTCFVHHAQEIPECQVDGDDWTMPPGFEACFLMRTDATGSTAATWDDVSAGCVADGRVLELSIQRNPNAEPLGTPPTGTCFADLEPEEMCEA
jgi:hypothetical protein